jgi:hypothetical protein
MGIVLDLLRRDLARAIRDALGVLQIAATTFSMRLLAMPNRDAHGMEALARASMTKIAVETIINVTAPMTPEYAPALGALGAQAQFRAVAMSQAARVRLRQGALG